jgi:hypothetical protein
MRCKLKDLRNTWYILMRDKRVYAKKVNNRIPKEKISANDMKQAKIRNSVKKYGYYDQSFVISTPRKNCLEKLVSLGYVQKRENEIVYSVAYEYVMHPYHPFVLPPRGLVISGVSNRQAVRNILLDSNEYSLFEKTSRHFRRQIDAKRHTHITHFEYNSEFSYRSDIYDVKDKYFDALSLGYRPSTHRLTVDLVEPIKYSRKDKDRKDWRSIRSINPKLFLRGSNSIDNEIATLLWKKDYIGILIYNNKAYFMSAGKSAKQSVSDPADFLRMPDFLNEEVYTYENMLSRVFEDAVKDFLIDRFRYQAISRYTPPYLRKELDVYAEKGIREKEITICECKFRIPNSKQPVTIEELNKFKEKKRKIEKIEKAHANGRLNFWLVTNVDNFEKGLKKRAEKAHIEIRQAILPKGWKIESDWKVLDIKKLH